VLRKWAGIWVISAMMVRIVDRWGGPDWNPRSSSAQEGETGVQCSPFSKSKRKSRLHPFDRCRTAFLATGTKQK